VEQLVKLELEFAAAALPAILTRAVKENLGTPALLEQFLRGELERREERRIRTSLRLSDLLHPEECSLEARLGSWRASRRNPSMRGPHSFRSNSSSQGDSRSSPHTRGLIFVFARRRAGLRSTRASR
jgi:hypothetical protein